MSDIAHRQIETNGIHLHVAERGEGPLVILCHGFPETWYSWRHQLAALADAGFHVVAPDQRGYGRSDGPADAGTYDILHLVGDIVGLVTALGAGGASIIGSDWGSVVAAHCALLRPDLFRAVGLLSVPYLQRQWGRHPPTEVTRRTSGSRIFYQLYMQQPDIPERELEADVRGSLLSLLYSLSGDAPEERRWQPYLDPGQPLVRPNALPSELPRWLSEEDLQTFVEDFSRTGFKNALNWYRNIDRNWELTAFLSGAPIRQPSLLLAGAHDPVFTLYRERWTERSMPRLENQGVFAGVGHWITQEDPPALNERLVEFLRDYGR